VGRDCEAEELADGVICLVNLVVLGNTVKMDLNFFALHLSGSKHIVVCCIIEMWLLSSLFFLLLLLQSTSSSAEEGSNFRRARTRAHGHAMTANKFRGATQPPKITQPIISSFLYHFSIALTAPSLPKLLNVISSPTQSILPSPLSSKLYSDLLATDQIITFLVVAPLVSERSEQAFWKTRILAMKCI